MDEDRARLENHISGIAALDEPVRRHLYLFVSGRHEAVSRDEAAQAVAISRALAAFHLDRLVEEGLLETEYRRLSGRTGPGAGRPSKLYRRSNRQIEVTLPPRNYELAARLFAEAVERSRSPEVLSAMAEVARSFGEELGTRARAMRGDAGKEETIHSCVEAGLVACGYEPCRQEDGSIRLRNCPFHALVSEHRDLVCGMNLALMEGLVDGLQTGGLTAMLDPQPGMCCVKLQPEKYSNDRAAGC
jgi:predicted ArsR family transcriptional regulator